MKTLRQWQGVGKDAIFRKYILTMNVRWRIYKAERLEKNQETVSNRLNVGVLETVVSIFNHT